jgi:hypothetical protein
MQTAMLSEAQMTRRHTCSQGHDIVVPSMPSSMVGGIWDTWDPDKACEEEVVPFLRYVFRVIGLEFDGLELGPEI